MPNVIKYIIEQSAESLGSLLLIYPSVWAYMRKRKDGKKLSLSWPTHITGILAAALIAAVIKLIMAIVSGGHTEITRKQGVEPSPLIVFLPYFVQALLSYIWLRNMRSRLLTTVAGSVEPGNSTFENRPQVPNATIRAGSATEEAVSPPTSAQGSRSQQGQESTNSGERKTSSVLKMIGVWLGVIVLFLTVKILFSMGTQTVQDSSRSQELLALADKLNRNLPAQTEASTRWDSVAAEGSTLRYHITRTQYVNGTDMDDERLKKDKLRRNLLKTTCTDKTSLVYRGITMANDYYDMNGSVIPTMSFTINKQDCINEGYK